MAVAMAGSVAGANVATAAGTDSPSASFSSPVANSSSTDPGSSTTATDPTGEPTITPEQLAAQIARANELRDQIVSRNGAIKAVLDKLDASTKAANSALEDYSKARNAEDDAKAESARQSEIAKALQDRLDEARDDLGSWAVDAYTQGGSWAESLSFLDALSQEADESSNPLTDLNFVTDNRIRSVEDLRELTVHQKLASMKSDAAADLAITAAAKAKKSKIAATAAVNAHRDELKTLQQANADVIAEAGPLAGALLGSGDQSAVDAANALSQALETANVDVSSLKLTPCTDKTGVWPNGQIPPSALCPLVGSTDEFLIPAAAAAFNAMSKAYAEETGNLICVTDGYRSYAEQVKIKEIRGPWAATPGTSEHGLGKALDLCGGIQSYSDPAHLWMVRNAPLFGWFHPSWAAQGGTLPEPWHWEFAG
jgi:D-alanyl-D-alanine carboxypeptidase